MRNIGGRSSALDRAQALLSARGSRGGAADPTEKRAKTASNTGPVGATRPVPVDANNFLSDLTDLSSVSSAVDHDPGTSTAKKSQGNIGLSFKDPEAQISIGGGRRFLKKKTSAANGANTQPSNHSQLPEQRLASSSEATCMRGLTQTESHSHKDSHLRAQEQRSKIGMAPQTSAPSSHKDHSSSNPSPRRLIKTKSPLPLNPSEERQRNLQLGDLVTTKTSLSTQERPCAVSIKKNPKIPSSLSSAALLLSASHSSHRGSPSKFKNPQSPSFGSPTPSPPCVSSPPLLNSPSRVESPHSSFSSRSGRNEVLSLDELFVAGSLNEDAQSEMSSSICEDFKMNILTLDDLGVRAEEMTQTADFTHPEEDTIVSEHKVTALTSPEGKGKEEGLHEGEEEEEVFDYQSDFESESRTEADNSAKQVVDDAQDKDQDISEPEIIEEDPALHGQMDQDYLARDSDSRCSSFNQSQASTCRSRGSRASSLQSGRSSYSSSSRVFKETAVQTEPDPQMYIWSTGKPKLNPEVHTTFVDPSPVTAFTVSAESLEALSTHNPAMYAINIILRQQLAMTRQFIDRSRYLHSYLVESLGPPNYRYTTLEETLENIEKLRAPKMTMEAALEEVQQEIKDSHYI